MLPLEAGQPEGKPLALRWLKGHRISPLPGARVSIYSLPPLQAGAGFRSLFLLHRRFREQCRASACGKKGGRCIADRRSGAGFNQKQQRQPRRRNAQNDCILNTQLIGGSLARQNREGLQPRICCCRQRREPTFLSWGNCQNRSCQLTKTSCKL